MKIKYTKTFKNHFKKYSKKYKSTTEVLKTFIDEIIENGFDSIPNLISSGNNLYKIRIACPEKNKGKSSGFRIAFLITENDTSLTFLALWMHPDVEDISKDELKKIAENELL